MPTSGSTDFNSTAREIIRDSFALNGIYHPGETPTAAEENAAARFLERMMKAWEADGIHLWTYVELTTFLTVGQAEYKMPGSRTVESFAETSLAADEPQGETSMDVEDTSGFSDGDTIGVKTSATNIHWTTVNGAPAGGTITLTTGLDEAAEKGNFVVGYSATFGRPLRIESIRRRHSGQDTPIIELGREDYFILPNKTTQSVPTQWYYDPQRATGTLFIWPTPDTVDDRLKITATRSIEDADALSNLTDFPTEWQEALTYNLAVRIAPVFGRKPRQDLIQFATDMRENLKGWDTEPASVHVQPNLRGWGW